MRKGFSRALCSWDFVISSSFAIRASSFLLIHSSFGFRYLLRDFNCQLQRCCRLKPRNAGLAASASRFDKRSKLTFERLFAFDLDLVTRNPVSNAPVNFAALILIIERELCVLLKNANFSHAFGTDATGRYVCHATILETQPRIRNVFAAAQNRNAHRIDALHGRTNEM
jgi:hypothetical protein